MKECKYRLPCNWCDRLNKYCDMVEPVTIVNTIKCEHEWGFYKSIEDTGGRRTYYRCYKCGAIKLVDEHGVVYESGEWQP